MLALMLACVGLFAPLALTWRAVLAAEEGTPLLHRVLNAMQRASFFVLLFGAPAAAVLALSVRLLLAWVFTLAVVIVSLRFLVTRTRARSATSLADANSSSLQSSSASPRSSAPAVLGLYHPHCDQRAGGEKVLWSLVHELLSSSTYSLVIYSNELPHARVAAGKAWLEQRTLSLAPSTAPSASTPASCDPASWPWLGGFILHQAAETFGLPSLVTPAARARVSFVFLAHTPVSDPQHYPRLTLLLQSAAAMLPAAEALVRAALASHTPASVLVPDAMLDTAGYPFALPIFACASVPSGAYVHYPVITHTMFARARTGTEAFAASATTSSSPATASSGAGAKLRALRAHAKVLYYRGFALLYRLVGLCARVCVANSHWTQRELDRVWGRSGVPPAWHAPSATASATAATAAAAAGANRAEVEEMASMARLRERAIPVVFPPCRTGALEPLPAAGGCAAPVIADCDGAVPCAAAAAGSSLAPPPLTWLSGPDDARKELLFVSLGQFRPEKDHMLQLDAFERAIQILSAEESKTPPLSSQPELPRLEMIGTSRPADLPRIAALREAIASRGLTSLASVRTDVPRAELDAALGRALGGLHSMRDEHFGIGVVEMMDAGVVTVAHRSAGPGMDIVVPAVAAVEGPSGKKVALVVAGAGAAGDVGGKSGVSGPVGYLATTVEEYAHAMVDIVRRHRASQKSSGAAAGAADSDSREWLQRMRQNARLRARTLFSEDAFSASVVENIVKPFDRILGRAQEVADEGKKKA